MQNKSKLNTILLVVIIILLVIVLGYFFLNNLENEKENVTVNNLPQDLIKNPVCNVGYESTPESKVISEQSPALITGFEKKCDNNYYITFDYLGPGSDNIADIENGTDSYYTNTNLKLRTFKVDPNIKVKLVDNTKILIDSYLTILKKLNLTIFNQNNAYIRNTPNGQPVFSITIKNGIVVLISEVYLP